MCTDFERLLEGFAGFRQTHYGNSEALMPRLVEEGQAPEYFIISCIDSRSNPGTIFQAKPGLFFGHKAMGAIVRPYQKGTALAAALQFAIHYSNVDKIIVLGHTHCGAIRALVEELDDAEISSFVSVAQQGLETAKKCCDGKGDLFRRTEEQIVLQSTANLYTYPSVRNALTGKRKLKIVSWLFNMEEGAIYAYDEAGKMFEKISAPCDR